MTSFLRSGGRQAVGKPARRRPPDRRARRAPLRRRGLQRHAPTWWKSGCLRSGGVIAIGGAVGKPARRRPPDRRARRAPLRPGQNGSRPRTAGLATG